ncbi:MAG: pyridoxamine 5'-phosphate oxidase [Actinobacteria bacterium]|uniref:Unannotated protein n=1 Tax=freshwater metagenome TaxID=449393 RepID=A0A6J7IVK2_9ZZZZ|nr:pyridoxamine 5'-phosphate oxidase [Actinomycetota bacterium]
MATHSKGLHAMRVGYGDDALNEGDLEGAPLAQFSSWLDDAIAAHLPEPNAMVLGTTDGAVPSVRTVLLKAADTRGFAFYTNLRSRKGRDLDTVPAASAVFPWFAMSRQVIVSGPVVAVPRDETAEYFVSRPRGSRLGAWASRQSEVIEGREPLDAAYGELESRWPEPEDIPLPDHWGGFLICPTSVEFWQGRASRLHDRLRFVRDSAPLTLDSGGARLDDDSLWRIERLSP